MQYPVPGMVLRGPEEAGQLTLLEAIGSGAFGIVFKAADTSSKTCAVKFPQVGEFPDSREVLAFFNEVKAATEIKHENVLSVLMVSTDSVDIPPYLVLEYADGGTLRDRIDAAGDSQLPAAIVVDWARQLVAGIAAINKKMLHRDLKPDNILFVGEVPKVADFGLAKLVGAATRSKTFKGGQHMYYMPPEAWMGAKNEIQIDMYSMGIVLFEMAALSFPYVIPRDPLDVHGLRDMHLNQPPRGLRSLRPDLPTRFCDIVMRLLEKRPRDRYAGWEEVEQALAEEVEGGHSGAVHPEAMTRIASVIQARHEAATRERLDQSAAAERMEMERGLDEYSRDRLTERLKGIIDEFNAMSQAAKIRISSTSADRLVIRIPYGRDLDIEYFGCAPMDLKEGKVRYAGAISDSDGCGFNLLLLRKAPDDLYGNWVVCRVRPSPFSRKALVPGCSSLAFDAKSLSEVAVAQRAIHVWVVEIGDDLESEFLSLLQECTGPKNRTR